MSRIIELLTSLSWIYIYIAKSDAKRGLRVPLGLHDSRLGFAGHGFTPEKALEGFQKFCDLKKSGRTKAATSPYFVN